MTTRCIKAVDDAAGKWRASTGGGYRPRWRPDGGEIFYLTADRTLMSVPVSWTPRFMAGSPTALFKTRTAGTMREGTPPSDPDHTCTQAPSSDEAPAQKPLVS